MNRNLIIPKGGTDTSDATATAGDIISPATAYAGGVKITGAKVLSSATNPLTIDLNKVYYAPEVYYFTAVDGLNVTGDLENLPSNIKYVYGGANVTGDITDIPSGVLGIYINGNESLTGSLANLPTGLGHLDLFGCTLVSGIYSPNATIDYIKLNQTGMSAADTDATIIALNAITAVSGTLQTALNRTATSDAAVTALQGKGWLIDD